MRYVILEKTDSGMRLAKDVYDSLGRTLVGRGCELTELYIEKLAEYGFDGVYIDDSISEGIEVAEVISPQLRAEGMACIRSANIDACIDIAKKMVEEILEKGILPLDLTDLRSYDDYTFAHSVNVAVICGVMGMGFEMTETELTHLITAALIHDLGKLSIPHEIVNKPGRLTPSEYEIMKTHAQISYDLIKERWDISSFVKTAVLFHHENVDGSGYPQGISGEAQTIYTKILHVADVFDALVSRRPYKLPYTPFDAIEYLMANCGTLFDMEAVKVLLNCVPLFPKGTEVQLSNGQKGIVYNNSGVNNLRPVVRLYDGTMIDLSKPEYFSYTLSSTREEMVHASKEFEEERNIMIGKTQYDEEKTRA